MDKEDKKFLIIGVLFVLFFILAVVGANLIQAKYIYKDMRCFWVECRILK
jgi:hypothetical protein